MAELVTASRPSAVRRESRCAEDSVMSFPIMVSTFVESHLGIETSCVCSLHTETLWQGNRSKPVDVDDGLGKGLWGFLRQVVPDTSRDDPMLVLTREFLSVG